ncbi:hypothetical protein PanWU01x14_367390 [Parasponia andersonii]|uniref:Uncharacterized protein n=1 Tax=Parasponia andersonii TaxID=3476 RepID=A0A2P5A5B1_PARAD|nr:hypothetical protein PanWU01x14_367390 [Parasponia andersonii]
MATRSAWCPRGTNGARMFSTLDSDSDDGILQTHASQTPLNTSNPVSLDHEIIVIYVLTMFSNRLECWVLSKVKQLCCRFFESRNGVGIRYPFDPIGETRGCSSGIRCPFGSADETLECPSGILRLVIRKKNSSNSMMRLCELVGIELVNAAYRNSTKGNQTDF